MKRSTPLTLLIIALLVTAIACGDRESYNDDTGSSVASRLRAQTFDLTLEGDSTFIGPHAGQVLTAALVAADGEVIMTMVDTVEANAGPAFSLTFDDAIDWGEAYTLDYWIDSNLGEGTTEGTCDPPPGDHQWRVSVESVDGPVTLDQDHAPDAMTDVCSSFEKSES